MKLRFAVNGANRTNWNSTRVVRRRLRLRLLAKRIFEMLGVSVTTFRKTELKANLQSDLFDVALLCDISCVFISLFSNSIR